MSMNKTWAISSWISFLTSAGIPIYLDMYATEETSQQRSRPSRSIIWDRAEQLAHCHPIHLFFLRSRVPVVQRREQGFLKESCTKAIPISLIFLTGSGAPTGVVIPSRVLKSPSERSAELDLLPAQWCRSQNRAASTGR